MNKVLIVDDEKDICIALEFMLSGEGYAIRTASSGEEALELLSKEDFSVVLTDLKMGEVNGIGVLTGAKRLNPECTVILMTAYASVESAVLAMKKGASDYIVKPFINEEVRLTLRRTLEQMKLRRENIALRREISQYRARNKHVVFVSDAMAGLFKLMDSVAPTRSNILLLGESGTGKSLLAELIHASSPRAGEPFISVNCSAIPENLLESELFGYRKGAFTGAVSDKTGLILMAHGGTLFMDEIGDMPPALQAKLLKVIETGEVMPLGDTKPRHADIRLITATHQDLEAMIADGSFREDLYYRVNVIEMTVPPLRHRVEDILPLAEHFVKKYSDENARPPKDISPEALELLGGYPWPGNVRELANVMERAVVLSRTDSILPGDLPVRVAECAPPSAASALKDKVQSYERSVIQSALETCGHEKEATSRTLGIDLATLYRKLKKHGIKG